ncbi:NAD(P)/FAD-dependent oxidoreductase [Staphylococcus sp. EG-SA-6]|uniref:Type II NADH:quinone oxidoreductase n=2 Tax=Staphylococcus haemolyticus TaxID=1283 RepID=NDH_STAHJ|nr:MULTISPECIES: NAD(P)/FAD-dependent oxidoreductase [Staphylococcus]Q4L4V6.1 RecName: Full=Type II NADH:quinone oxidoreductase; AltName: Full=NDH-2 [Staphylococcus haemolyticus JCSC1435]KDP50952.1 pyridine nucleotide-disulfide oxidoreductase [Staphylococcus aureus subsp. aureus CO-98]MBN4935566.1 NAD(P)/FAD-dependent oxidoreductase [Staphylococcus sp. EG-SA-6]MBY6180049.1 NAD(P)/FAD-dependent oxidoreductase [Staphylococcaceae bacterium DP2N0-1]MDU2098255.1 NAD(P)/FAD-dependent oxidoreductase 
MAQDRKKVLVLGAGYAGLQTVTKLQKELSADEADITLINKNKYHYEATWLHEASAGTLNYEDLIYPIESVIKEDKVKFINAEVTKIDRNAKKVETNHGIYDYDILVVALGFESETFGINGMKDYAFQIENIETARKLSRHIEDKFANYAASKEKDDKDLAILVGGAGFTGIEFLGELTERIPELCNKYGVDQNKVRVTCVEAAPKMLPMFSDELVNYAVNYLEDRGVEFKIATPIVACNEKGFVVKINDQEQQLEAGTAIWAAGVRGSKLMEESFEGVKRGRIVTKQDLTIEGHDDIFVIGDVSAFIPAGEERPLPTTAQIAMQQGEHVAKSIKNILNGQAATDFEYVDRGTVCSLGAHDGVGIVYGRDITGKKAAFMKKVIDTRAVFKIGGVGLAFKKGKF